MVLVAAVGFALRPEHLVGSVALGLVLVWWALVVKSAFPAGPWSRPAALLAAHVAALLLGYGPPTLPVDPTSCCCGCRGVPSSGSPRLVVWLVGTRVHRACDPDVVLAGRASAPRWSAPSSARVVVPTRDIQADR